MLGAPEVLAPALGAGADWRAQADEWAARGLRVVMFAGRDEPAAFSADPDAPPVLPEGLEALALICFSDELRPGVRGTLEEFSEAGIDVKIISGDNPKTVVALATQAGVQSLRRREGVDSYCDMVTADATTAAAPGEATQAGDAAPTPARRTPARPPRPRRPSARSSPSPAPSSPSSRPRTSPPRPTRPASSAASRPSRSRTSSRPCATAGATSR